MVDSWADNYFVIGPYIPEKSRLYFRELEECKDTNLAIAIERMKSLGFRVRAGQWILDNSRPKAILIETDIEADALNYIKSKLWENHQISCLRSSAFSDQAIAFGELVKIFILEFARITDYRQDIVAHFYEWMTACGLPEIAAADSRIGTVFSINGTIPGRYMADSDQNYYSNFLRYDIQNRGEELWIETQIGIEKLAVQSTQILTANNAQTARECEAFYNRNPDNIIPGALNSRPLTAHQVFDTHKKNRAEIDSFIKGHFYPNYKINTDNCLYFFTAGRYEYHNKGFDVTLKAACRLNRLLKDRNSNINIVLFIVTKRDFHHVKPAVLESKARFLELQKICKRISASLGPHLYGSVVSNRNGKMPDLNGLVDEELLQTWRQAVMNFKTNFVPCTTTHEMKYDDEITDFLRKEKLNNGEENPVKIIYHADFMERTRSPLGMDFHDFVSGCHLGIFPDLYQPWGYTAMETVMAGTPVIMSDASGFANFTRDAIIDPQKREIQYIQRRNASSIAAANELTQKLVDFIDKYSSNQFVPRSDAADTLFGNFNGHIMNKRYNDTYRQAMLRKQPETHLY